MGSLSKDTVAVANPAAEGAAAPTSAANKPTAGLRQDALSLEVPVKVHGSRVTEVTRGVTPRTEPFEEQTSTMIIFPQGGVLRMSASVSTGQMLVLTNLKTKQDAICRVVKVRTFTNMQGYVEVEFTHPQPTYWGVGFPGEKPVAGTKPAAPVIPPTSAGSLVPPHEEVKPKPVGDVSRVPAQAAPPAPTAVKHPAPVAPLKPYVAPAKPASTFIGIESKEEVQPAASATATTRAIPPVDPFQSRDVAKPVIKDALVSSPVARAANASAATTSLPPLSMTELLSDSESASLSIAIEPANEAARTLEQRDEKSGASAASVEASGSAFGGLAAPSSTDSGQCAVTETFGSRFDSSAKVEGTESAKGSPNWMFIAAAVGLVVLVVGGGAFYLRGQRGNGVSTTPAVAPANTSQRSAPAPAEETATPQVTQPTASVPGPLVANPVVAPHGNIVVVTTPRPRTPAATTSKPSNDTNATQPESQPARVTGNMVADSVNAHPVTSQHSSEQEVEAPSVDVAPSGDISGGALPSLLSSSDGPAAPGAPEVKSEAPVRVGGNVKEPRLITSPAPIYPLIAKQAHVQGDVVIKTTIDQRGNVTHTEVISGPPMLRGAALEALKRWKYAPSMLNGEPIVVQMMVTLKFRM